jgi:hypothetical protein
MEFYLFLLLFALSSAVVGAQAAVRLLYLPERKKFLKQLSGMQRTAAEQQEMIASLQSQLTQQGPTPSASNSILPEGYEAYKKNGGTLDELSYLLAQEDHLRFP